MIDLFANVDFEPLYYDIDACLAFLRSLPNIDSLESETMDFHLYWKTVRPFGRKQLLPIKSFIATQPLNQFRLNLWSNSDLTKSPLLKPWLRFINFRLYDPVEETKGTLLESSAQARADDTFVYSGGDIFRALILHKYGGVYVDMDSVFLRAFSPLFGAEFMYKWSFQPTAISSAVMWLKKQSPLSAELLRGILELPQGGTNWGCENNVRAHSKLKFRVFPCAFFNPEWQIKLTPDQKARLSVPAVTFEPFIIHEFSHEMYTGSFTWHWHNRWESPVQPGCKFELLEARVDSQLREKGLL